MSRLALLRLLLPAALLTFTASAQADAHSDVAALIQRAKPPKPSPKRKTIWPENARDPQMRFLQGSAQSAAGDTQAAITTFTLLTQEYPELPEPYNNLAVLYAGQGQLEQARGALLQAVRNNPSYPVAYENLGDIYLRLAHEAFSQATKLQGAQPDVQRKLSGLRPLLQP